jgi:hypothetical protein
VAIALDPCATRQTHTIHNLKGREVSLFLCSERTEDADGMDTTFAADALASAGMGCVGQHLAESHAHRHLLWYAVNPYCCHATHLLSFPLFYTETTEM